MKLGSIFNTQDIISSHPNWHDLEISGLSLNSQTVEKGYLFAALQGTSHHGKEFINHAIAQGSIALLTDTAPITPIPENIVLLQSDVPHQTLAIAAAKFYNAQPPHITAITGTNGKTSIAFHINEIFEKLSYPSATVGTFGVRSKDFIVPETLTTPDCIFLHQFLARLDALKVKHVAIEASSHGLAQFRLDGVHPDVGVFSNLTRDHLDYHLTEQNYFNAKARLFRDIIKRDGHSVVNLHCPFGVEIAEISAQRRLNTTTLGPLPSCTLYLKEYRETSTGCHIDLTIQKTRHRLSLPVMSEFQVHNILLAAAAVQTYGFSWEQILALLPSLTTVPGRLELIGSLPNNAQVLVDFAHTPDGMHQILRAMGPRTKGKLWCLFGAGGERDTGKRPLMGAVAHQLADHAIVTDDNPRTENPDQIRAQILEACPQGINIADRKQAILYTINQLEENDILIVTGKGHETKQLIGSECISHDDRQIIKTILSDIWRRGHA